MGLVLFESIFWGLRYIIFLDSFSIRLLVFVVWFVIWNRSPVGSWMGFVISGGFSGINRIGREWLWGSIKLGGGSKLLIWGAHVFRFGFSVTKIPISSIFLFSPISHRKEIPIRTINDTRVHFYAVFWAIWETLGIVVRVRRTDHAHHDI